MIAQNYYSEDIPLSLQDLVRSYNSSCPSMCNYGEYNYIPYILTSSILMEVLLKRIHFKINGRYRGIHSPSLLADSLGSFGVTLRKFSPKEREFLKIDHSFVRFNFNIYNNMQLEEELVDGLFKYFLDLAVGLGVE